MPVLTPAGHLLPTREMQKGQKLHPRVVVRIKQDEVCEVGSPVLGMAPGSINISC